MRALPMLAFLIFHLLFGSVEASVSQTYFYKVTTGGKLHETDVISSLNVDSQFECSYECLTQPGCILFNYISPSIAVETNEQVNCQLSNKTREDIIPEDGQWTFFQELKTLKNESCSGENPNINSPVAANCADLFDSGVTTDGVYTIDPDGQGSFEVRCESGGWTVVQKRLDGSVDFFLGWSQYKSGFGNLNGEFWLGLDKIHRLTKSGLKKLRIDLMDFNNAQVYAQYTSFQISDETNRYTLAVSGYSGNAGDSLKYHNGHKFSTKDNDITSSSCATNRKGAWWYDACAWSNLNGQYLGPNQDQWHGIQWRFWKDTNECMKRADMKLRPQ